MCALLSAFAAIAATVVAVPASAAAAPAAIEEYDLALPQDDGPQEPAPTPEPEPVPEAAPAPPAPVLPETAPTSEALPVEPARKAAPAKPKPQLDQAAARRDVLFEAPAPSSEREARSLVAPVEDSSLPPTLWLLFALGGACILATLVRLRRFAVSLGASPPAVPRSQTSS